MKKIILASASPRRKEILDEMGLTFEVMPADIDETLSAGPPREAALELACKKAETICGKLRSSGRHDTIVIGADTIVLSAGKDGIEEVIGKPDDDLHAEQILRRLSGSTHSVVTAVCVLDTASGRAVSGWDETRLTMRKMTDAQIRAYVESGESHGKAGAYGLQENDPYVTDVQGSHTNVLGLPAELLREILAESGAG